MPWKFFYKDKEQGQTEAVTLLQQKHPVSKMHLSENVIKNVCLENTQSSDNLK